MRTELSEKEKKIGMKRKLEKPKKRVMENGRRLVQRDRERRQRFFELLCFINETLVSK
jgi:hypothetical protein